MTTVLTSGRRAGFVSLLHAEWTKFRTVAGWGLGMAVGSLMIVLVGVLAGVSSDQQGAPPVPVGPGGAPVADSFYFAHRPLTADGGITVSVTALESSVPAGPGDLRPGQVAWAKAGLIIKESTRPGSPYAAIMVTGGHGVRMQSGFVDDIAGPAGTEPVHWLRLLRSGDTVTGYSSADGTQWTEVGTVRVRGLGPRPRGGPFVASPPSVDGMGTRSSVSTAVFGDLRVEGSWADDAWTGEQVGPESPTFAGYPPGTSGSSTASGGELTITGAGDIAPAVRETLATGGTVKDILTGTFAALVVMVVVGTLYITTEYRKNLIRVTLAVTPGRGRVLVAKAIVVGSCAFVAGLAGALAAVPLGERLAEVNGVYVFPVSSATGLRVALGTAALLAAAAVLALSVGAILRRGAGAVTAVLLVIVLPYLLIANPFMPAGVAGWLARVTPAAAFAVHQTLEPYEQVASVYTPYNGYFPLPAWAGLAVLAGYAAVSLAVAVVLLRRREA
ncbi:ABC transporter permease subunit [Phytomonospora sp. NPDC050363]|uniref:ABC transporter permease subunit n=1 Tax=Phytomonospora sp. NPDC050363 TaxID=3155642 RepID=UPI0033E6CB58